jgi:hypothetical protein
MDPQTIELTLNTQGHLDRSQCFRTESLGNKTWISKKHDQRLARQNAWMLPTKAR